MAMHRVMVNAVSGKKIMADGKWLTPIGNINVKAGDYVWTDGKCIYGHQQEGGGNNLVITSSGGLDGIPLLYSYYYAYYANGKVSKIGSHNLGYNERMINRNNHFRIFNILKDFEWWRPALLLDAEFDDEGNLYILFSNITYNDQSNGLDAAAGVNGGFFIEKNGVLVAQYNASEFLRGLGWTRGVLFYVDYAKLNTDGSFKVMLSYYFSGEPNREDITRRFFFDGKNTETWTHNGYSAPAHSIRFPIQDGWFFTFAGYPDDESFLPELQGRYTINCYNPNGELAFTTQHYLPYITSVSPVGSGKYLFMVNDSAFGKLNLWDNGSETTLQWGCGNLRLRKGDIKKWKKTIGL